MAKYIDFNVPYCTDNVKITYWRFRVICSQREIANTVK